MGRLSHINAYSVASFLKSGIAKRFPLGTEILNQTSADNWVIQLAQFRSHGGVGTHAAGGHEKMRMNVADIAPFISAVDCVGNACMEFGREMGSQGIGESRGLGLVQFMWESNLDVSSNTTVGTRLGALKGIGKELGGDGTLLSGIDADSAVQNVFTATAACVVVYALGAAIDKAFAKAVGNGSCNGVTTGSEMGAHIHVGDGHGSGNRVKVRGMGGFQGGV